MTVAERRMNRQEIELVERFVVEQHADRDKAAYYAREILSADADIREAALMWGRTGVMLDRPVIEGRSPLSLAPHHSPSCVFSILIALRIDPVLAVRCLRFWPRTSISERRREHASTT
jgi:hypothetical protein